MDAYGPTVAIGGGAWSGKDFNKVDRVGALLAREMAFEAMGEARFEARVEIRFEPGRLGPVSSELWIDGVTRQSRLGALEPVDTLGIGSCVARGSGIDRRDGARSRSMGNVSVPDWRPFVDFRLEPTSRIRGEPLRSPANRRIASDAS